MALTDSLERMTETVNALAAALASVAAQPIRVDVVTAAGAAGDRTDAEAIKRGQRPETIAALRKAIGS